MSTVTEPRDGRLNQRVNSDLLARVQELVSPLPMGAVIDAMFTALVEGEIAIVNGKVLAVNAVKLIELKDAPH